MTKQQIATHMLKVEKLKATVKIQFSNIEAEVNVLSPEDK